MVSLTPPLISVHSDSISPGLSVAILRALVAWVDLRKDFEISFFGPVTKALMQFSVLPSSSKGEIVFFNNCYCTV